MEPALSSTAQLMITIIPIAGIAVGGVIVFFFLLWNHRQRMAQINQGMEPRRLVDLGTFSLLLGLVSGAVGVALTVVQLLVGANGYGLLGGLIPLMVGVAFLVFFRMRGRGELERSE